MIAPSPGGTNLAYACVGHLLGDFVFQNDYLAAGKKRSSWICAGHCLIWTFFVVVCGGLYVWWVPPVLFATHFLQDRWNLVPAFMRLNGQERFASPPMAPWSLIVVDNVLHVATIAAVISQAAYR